MNNNSTSQCHTCETIPVDAVLSAEGAEYVEHFCGRDVLDGYLSQAHESASQNVFIGAQPLIA